MAGIKRLPYRIPINLWQEDKCTLFIKKSESSDLNTTDSFDSFPLEVPIDIAYFIHMHCTCAYCGESIHKDLSACSCDESIKSKYHIEAQYPTEIYSTIFYPLVRREQGRAGSMRRQERLKENGGSYTKEEIAELYKIQKGMCYYCGTEVSNDKSNQYHLDHYEPIFMGGTNDITNIVLSCSSCNLAKGTISGDKFKRLSTKKNSFSTEKELKEIRRKVKAFVKKKQLS